MSQILSIVVSCFENLKLTTIYIIKDRHGLITENVHVF